MKETSLLHEKRLQYKPVLPEVLRSCAKVSLHQKKENRKEISGKLRELFPKTMHNSLVELVLEKHEKIHSPLRVGVVFSGGQASGGHNVISGLYDALKELNRDSSLWGFLGGPSGVIEGKVREITADLIAMYRNQGGFDLIGSGRTKIETEEQLQGACKTCQNLRLDGLVIIGGDDSNTNAAILAEHFSHKNVATRVIGVPKTIDGDLKTEYIEISFGYDTACKIYSEMIGNIGRDALSAKKYYHFIRLMGRSASHITLECALATHPNVALISEEIAEKKLTLQAIVNALADVISQRSEQKKDYGIVLIPEGLIEFIPEIKTLLKELNGLLAEGSEPAKKMSALSGNAEKVAHAEKLLTKESHSCFKVFPEKIQQQLLLDRDPHGNVHVSGIETEKLLSELVAKELKKRKQDCSYKGKFSAVEHFFGYEGRAGLPSNFDATYCYALGHVAAILVNEKCSGYIAAISNLTMPAEKWQAKGIPLAGMLHIETRQGKDKPVIKKALVDLKGKPFLYFQKMRSTWQSEDRYRYPGPMQFFGDRELTDLPPLSMLFE